MKVIEILGISHRRLSGDIFRGNEARSHFQCMYSE